ncbi:hypothetical protein GCM10010307_19980 [Streptomyces vastus]|uniref:Ricin B lectin domain-containing protein n=1 Tax=Streptomyces vastus TaxID=285451 RepID=A0ABP6CY40_9ACTN
MQRRRRLRLLLRRAGEPGRHRYSSTDEGESWKVLNVIATGGRQGGSAGAVGRNVAKANTYKQVDPLWEPYLMVHDGKLVCYYSDENDYLGFDPVTGVPKLDPDNDTARDSHGQILVHKTWNGRSAQWSEPVVDVAGLTQDMGGGKTQIGGGRPGMTTVVPTTDGKWLLPYEYWGGGTNTRYVLADDPLKFYRGSTDSPVTSLPVDAGSRRLAVNGSPVVINLPDGRLVYNAAGSGNVWVNESGRSDGVWKEYQTNAPASYSRNLQYVEGTGRISILNHKGTSTIAFSEVDQGRSEGAYYQLVNRKTGQVIGTGGKSNDANTGNGDVPDVRLEDAGSVANKDTRYWHLATKADGALTLLNKSGGRAAGIWTADPTVGQRIGQWVDNTPAGLWNLTRTADGYYKFQAAKNTNVYLTGASAGAPLTLQNAVANGSQEWQLVQQAPTAADLMKDTQSKRLTTSTVRRNATLSLNAAASDPAGTALHANKTGRVYVFAADGKVTDLGRVSFDEGQKGSVALPGTIAGGKKVKIAVVFDDTPLMWDAVTVRAAASES